MWDVGGVPIVPRNYGLVFSSFFFTTMAALVVGMRTYTRAVLVKNVGADDMLMIVAFVSPHFAELPGFWPGSELTPGVTQRSVLSVIW